MDTDSECWFLWIVLILDFDWAGELAGRMWSCLEVKDDNEAGRNDHSSENENTSRKIFLSDRESERTLTDLSAVSFTSEFVIN